MERICRAYRYSAALAGTVVGNGARIILKARQEGFEGELTITGSLSSAATATLLAQRASSMQPLVAFAIGAVLGGAVGDSGDQWITKIVEQFVQGERGPEA